MLRYLEEYALVISSYNQLYYISIRYGFICSNLFCINLIKCGDLIRYKYRHIDRPAPTKKNSTATSTLQIYTCIHNQVLIFKASLCLSSDVLLSIK